MSKNIEMNEHQIYKWFWETNKKSLNVNQDTIDLFKMNSKQSINQLSDQSKFEIFAKKALKRNKYSPELLGWDGYGKVLAKQDILSAIKVHW